MQELEKRSVLNYYARNLVVRCAKKPAVDCFKDEKTKVFFTFHLLVFHEISHDGKWQRQHRTKEEINTFNLITRSER